MYVHMIQQAAAFLYASEGRYVLSLQFLFSSDFFPIQDLALANRELLRALARSSHSKEHLWPTAKTLRTANGYSAEPRGRGIFLNSNKIYKFR